MKFLHKIKKWIRSKRFWKRFVALVVGLPTLLFFILVLIVYVKQDEIVQDLVKDMNKDFVGATEIKESHISMFENFPYISIDLQEFKVYESKAKNTKPLIDIHHVYAGFNLWTVLTGKMEIKKIKLKQGKISIVQHKDGSFNIVKALSPVKEIEDTGEEFHLDLKKIELEDIDLTKLNEYNGLKVETFIEDAHFRFKTNGKHVSTSWDTKFVMNIIKNGDTTFFKHKHIDLDTEIDFLKVKDVLTIEPTTVHLEGSEFSMSGTIDILDDLNLDLTFNGNKPNFDLFVAMAPEEYIPVLKSYETKGDIYIKTKIKGKSIKGHAPAVRVDFGCHNGTIVNPKAKKTIKNLNFEGFLTNGEAHNLSTTKLSLHKFEANPDAGKIFGDIDISDFNAPHVQMDFNSKVDMNFLSSFLNLNHLHQVGGTAEFNLLFDDIIDINNPEHTVSKLNEKYEMEVRLKDVHFKSDDFALPIKKFDMLARVKGHQASILKCNLLVGKSDVEVVGTIDDLPAIIHHTDIPVDTRLKVSSKFLDLFELTGSDKNKSIDEQIEGLRLNFDFKASARSFTESKYLPKGEFFIEDLYAKLKHYPHTLHDFHADIIVEEQDLLVKDFKGMIDNSDFLFSGKLEHYEKWLDEHPGGDSKIEFNLESKKLQLESFFTYKGENYVPEEYRHEELDNVKIHGFTFLHYKDVFQSMDLTIDKFAAKMKVHPLKFEDFEGRVHYEKDHLVVEDFHGKLGKSKFKTTLHYYLGTDEKQRKRENHFSITASRLDIDQLIKYNPAPKKKGGKAEKVDHDAGFNIYDLPFTNMTYHIDIGHLNYHRYLMHNIKGNLRTTPKHYIYVDHLKLDAAGGSFDVDGYFNGSNPDLIYFNPKIKAKNVDLDKFLFKFDNFGQDHIVAENLHGKFTGTITGKIHMHTDLVPKIDDSEIHMDVDVIHGRLENYSLLSYMSDYFHDKNLNKVLFDTLNNHIDMVNGVMTIPTMTINSSLGHLEISGKQDMNGQMEYYLKIPWKMVTSTASSKLFGRKKEEVSDDQVDEIQYGNKKTKYVNVKIIANDDGYKFSIGKKKK